MEVSLEKINSKNPKIKYGYIKELVHVAAEQPVELYDSFDFWLGMLQQQNNILKWNAIQIIGYLSSVDAEDKIENVLPEFYNMLHVGNLITSNNIIFSLGIIFKNQPQHRERIVQELLKIEDDTFGSAECKLIAMGKVIEILTPLTEHLQMTPALLQFVTAAANCTRNATKSKALKFVKKMQGKIK